MFAETVSLGILSLPHVLSAIGMAPGVIIIAAFGAISAYTGYVIGQFKLLHPNLQSMGDVGEILFETFGPRWGPFGPANCSAVRNFSSSFTPWRLTY